MESFSFEKMDIFNKIIYILTRQKFNFRTTNSWACHRWTALETPIKFYINNRLNIEFNKYYISHIAKIHNFWKKNKMVYWPKGKNCYYKTYSVKKASKCIFICAFWVGISSGGIFLCSLLLFLTLIIIKFHWKMHVCDLIYFEKKIMSKFDREILLNWSMVPHKSWWAWCAPQAWWRVTYCD